MADEVINVTAHPKVILVRRELSADDLVTLNEEIAALARAGLPLDQGLAALAREMRRGRLQQVTAELASDLKAGRTLPEALAKQGGRVPPYYAALVTAGVRSGRVDQVLATLTAYARTVADLRATVIGALLYPALIFILGLALVTSITAFLVPHFEATFTDMRLEIPTASKWAFAMSRDPLVFLVLPPALLAAGFLVLRFSLRQSEAGERLWARWVYAIPLVGTLLRRARLASYADLLGILVEHEVPLPDAFHLAGAAASDPLAVFASRHVEEALRSGRSLVEALQGRREFPKALAWMIGMGERRGKLAPTLRSEAERYRRQAQQRARLLSSLLPPLFLIVTAVLIIAIFGIAIFWPLLTMLEGLGMRI